MTSPWTALAGSTINDVTMTTLIENRLDTLDAQVAPFIARHGVRLRRAANQSIPNNGGSPTAVSWDTADEDTDSYFSAGTPTVITIPAGKGGIYAITYHQILSANPTGRTFAEIVPTSSITGMPAGFRISANTSETGRVDIGITIPLAAADTFVANTFQTSGGALNLTAWLTAYRVSI